MRIDAISVGKPKWVKWEEKEFQTSIFRHPVSGPVRVHSTHIEGDEASDKKLHGGPTRPVSVYASEYYEYWQARFEQDALPWGFFGENLNISGGMFEKEIMVGDRFKAGTVEFEALQPRFPCHKLGMKMGDQKWVKPFLDSGKTGFYFGVSKPGIINPGDPIEKIYSNENSISMDDITDLYLINKNNRPLLEKALTVEALTPRWKAYFEKELEKLIRS